MSFPVSPVNGQTTSTNGIVYTYNSTNSAWKRTPGVSNPGVGFGQTWQAVTRVVSNNYTNTTGRPIVVAPLFNNPSNGTVSIIVDGILTAYLSEGSVAGNNTKINALVPPGSVYSFTVTGGASLTSCTELR